MDGCACSTGHGTATSTRIDVTGVNAVMQAANRKVRVDCIAGLGFSLLAPRIETLPGSAVFDDVVHCSDVFGRKGNFVNVPR